MPIDRKSLRNSLKTLKQLELPKWSQLRAIGNSPAVKMTVLIPVLGYAIIFNAEIVKYLHLSKEILSVRHLFSADDAAEVNASISWRLLCLYFGMCLIAVGSLIYTWRCPIIIKMYPTAPEYVAQVRDHVAGFVQDTIMDELAFTQYGEKIVEIGKRLERALDDAQAPYVARLKRELLSYYFAFKNESYPRARRAATILYLLGFGVTAVPSLDIFVRVTLLLVRSIIHI